MMFLYLCVYLTILECSWLLTVAESTGLLRRGCKFVVARDGADLGDELVRARVLGVGLVAAGVGGARGGVVVQVGVHPARGLGSGVKISVIQYRSSID